MLELHTSPADNIDADFVSQVGANDIFALSEDSYEEGEPGHILADPSPSRNGVSNDENEETTQSPVVWAKTRSGLCDALPYFRSHKGDEEDKEDEEQEENENNSPVATSGHTTRGARGSRSGRPRGQVGSSSAPPCDLEEYFTVFSVKYSSKSMTFESKAFNELLALGYFESSTISYHDDGEKDLGPTVATLSLGSPSIKRFRPKKKSPIGEDRKKKKTPVSTDSKRRGGNKAAVIASNSLGSAPPGGSKAAVISIPLFHGEQPWVELCSPLAVVTTPPRTVMVIAGKRKLGMEGDREYCVLGEYQVTDLWLEKFPNSDASEETSEKSSKDLAASWMVRLEKVKFNGPSWFDMNSTSHSSTGGQYHPSGVPCDTRAVA
ncbi:hypothetical protein E8E14_013035 [Neopestalotiopsis sp. 37M]|nr:hypothetical protein E8E14_013035 [Neopestalotiopsis sp. 37M]